MTSLSGYRGGGIFRTSKRTVSYEKVDPSITKTMHWKFLSCKEYGSGVTEPTITTMKDEKIPEIGPPMGETGSCLSYNYMGSSKLDPLTVYVRCWEPHWCMRKITTSLGKALREQLKKSPLWNSSHSLVFCSFKKTLEALKNERQTYVNAKTTTKTTTTTTTTNDSVQKDICRQPLFRNVLKGILVIALCEKESDVLVSLGLYNYVILVRHRMIKSQRGVPTMKSATNIIAKAIKDKKVHTFINEYAVANTLVIRIYLSNVYMNSTQSGIQPNSKIGLWMQLWTDEMLDLAYHTMLGNLMVKDKDPPDEEEEEEEKEKERGGGEEEEGLLDTESRFSVSNKETESSVFNRVKKEEKKRKLIHGMDIDSVLDTIPIKKEPIDYTEEVPQGDSCDPFDDLFGSFDSSEEYGNIEEEEEKEEEKKSWEESNIKVKKEFEEEKKEIKSEPVSPDRFTIDPEIIASFPLLNYPNDERLDISECGVRCDEELYGSGAMFAMNPHGRRFVAAGELLDITELVLRGNIWREIRPTTKDFLSHLIHLLMSKPLLHKCMIRNIEIILGYYCEQDPLLTCLIKDLVHITMLGNYPTAKRRPGFLARMFLRRDNLAFFKSEDHVAITWFKENRKFVYYTMKEFYLYLITLTPPIESLLRETQWHTEHTTGIRKCMDEIRFSLEKSYTDQYYKAIDSSEREKLLRNIRYSDSVKIGEGITIVENVKLAPSCLSKIKTIIKRVHNSQLKYITKLRKGSFAQVLHNEMRSWYSREDKEDAMERFRSGKRAKTVCQASQESPVEEEIAACFPCSNEVTGSKPQSSFSTSLRKNTDKSPKKNAKISDSDIEALLYNDSNTKVGDDVVDDDDDDDESEYEDSDEDLGKQIMDSSLAVVEKIWKDDFQPAYPEDTSGHEFRTSIPLTQAIEYMYGSEDGDEDYYGFGSEDVVMGGEEEEEEEESSDTEDEMQDLEDEDIMMIYKEELAIRLTGERANNSIINNNNNNDEDEEAERQKERILKDIESSGIIGKRVLVDPDDFLTQDERNAIYLVAQYAKTRYDGVFEFWWLYPLGLSADGFYWLKEMYYRFEITDVADNRLRTNLEYLFCKRPRDFYILLGFLKDYLTSEDPERIWLGEHVAISQIEACRTKFSVMPWESSNIDLLGTRHYCVCGEWGDMVVGPFSEKRDSYSVGLSGVYYDALTGKIHCRKDKEECCQDELRRINMIGWAVKHGGRWYALCTTCGMITHWNMNQQSHRGPDCGQHRLNAEYATAPDGQRAVIIDGIAVTDHTRKKKKDPPGLERLHMARKRAGISRREVTRQCLFCRTDGRGAQGVAVWVLRIPQKYDCTDYSNSSTRSWEYPALFSRKAKAGEELQKLNPTQTVRKHYDSCLERYNELGRFEVQDYVTTTTTTTTDGSQPVNTESQITAANDAASAAAAVVNNNEDKTKQTAKENDIKQRNVEYNCPQLVRVWLCSQDWKNARSMLSQYPVPFMQDLISWISNARKQKIRRTKTRRIIHKNPY